MNKKNNESSNCCPDHVTGYGEFYDELDGNVNYSMFLNGYIIFILGI